MGDDWRNKLRSGEIGARTIRRFRREIAIRRHRLSDPSVFIWIPKVAGTSIFRALRPYGCRRVNVIDDVRSTFDSQGCVTFGHISYRALIEEGSVTDRFARDAFRFSFVRNPFDRAVSLWAYLSRFDLFPSDLPFDGFVELIAQRIDPVGLYNTRGLSQCNPQTDWLDFPGGSTETFVGRYENLQGDFDAICAELKLPRLVLPHHNPSDRVDYRRYYNSRSRQMVEEIYRRDLESFDYDF